MPTPSSVPESVAVIIPAKDEADRIAATVASAKQIAGVDLIVVVDDGSTDHTSELASRAGARLVRHPVNRGKAAAMQSGARAVASLEYDANVEVVPRALLFIDADLGESAVNTEPLTAPILAGDADMTIAILPRQTTAGGGRGFVVKLARKGIVEATKWTPTQPLSGMRCLTRAAFEAALPLAAGWGVETGLTIDLLRAGLRVEEVPCDLHHRVTGKDWRGQVHRAKQYRDVARALAARRVFRALRPR